MHLQAEIDFATPTYSSNTDDPRVAELLDMLNERGWTPGRQIHEVKGWDERTIRLLAAASDGQIISGQKGYKLTREATPEELRHATAWLESQANQMSNRARAIRRCWYGWAR
jgi:hypothetical protein